MYREISPDKLRARRGERSRSEIAARVNKAVTEQDIYAYEKGQWKPSRNKLPHLLAALECTYDEVSDPVELATS